MEVVRASILVVVGLCVSGSWGHAADGATDSTGRPGISPAADAGTDGGSEAPATDDPFAAPPASPADDPFAASPATPADDPFAGSGGAGATDRNIQSLAVLSLEDILTTVVTASKTAENIYESPAIVTVLGGEQIRAWGYTSLAEVLRHVVGFYVIDDHQIPNAAVRGVSGGLRAESSVVKVMIDGQAIAFRSTSGNWLGAALIPLTIVQRIEIIRGPASALYGADAFLGVINIITESGEKLTRGRVALSGMLTGENPGGDLELALGSRNGPLDLLLAARLRAENRNGLTLPDSSPAPHLPAWRDDDLEARGLQQYDGVGLVRLGYHVSERTSVSLTGYAALLDHGGEFADWYQLASGLDPRGRFSENRVSLAHGFARLAAAVALTDDLDLALTGAWFQGKPTGRDRVDVGSEIFFVKRRFGFRGVDSEASATWRILPELTLVAGAGLIVDDERMLSIEHVLKESAGRSLGGGTVHRPSSTVQGNKLLVNPGAFAQAIWKPFERLLGVTVGLRYDRHNIYGNELSGRVALVSTPLDGLHCKLLLGNAFKAPTPLQLYAVPYTAGDVIGNAALEAQHVRAIEGQVVYEALPELTATVGAAYMLVTDKAEFTPQGANQVARNLAEVGSFSLEGELAAHYRDYLTGYFNLAYNVTVSDTGEEGYRANLVGHEGTLYPPFQANLGVRGRLPWLPVGGSVELSYCGSRRASSDNILENVGDYRLDPYALLGATLSTSGPALYEGKQSTLLIVGRNLLGANGPEPGFGGIDYPLVGRSIMLQWRQEL